MAGMNEWKKGESNLGSSLHTSTQLGRDGVKWVWVSRSITDGEVWEEGVSEAKESTGSWRCCGNLELSRVCHRDVKLLSSLYEHLMPQWAAKAADDLHWSELTPAESCTVCCTVCWLSCSLFTLYGWKHISLDHISANNPECNCLSVQYKGWKQ